MHTIEVFSLGAQHFFCRSLAYDLGETLASNRVLGGDNSVNQALSRHIWAMN